MASPDLVNMMAFIQNGQAFPKSLDPKRKKGNVSSESLVGYSRYTSRENANDSEKQKLDYAPGGYYKYTNERPGSTKTYTNEGWIDSKAEMTQFRNYVASNFQEEGKLAWLPVQSYKDYATASQYGLFSDEDYAQITKNTLNRFFKHVGLEPSNMIWWMNYHNNKNHPHVHVAFLEKETTRERGQFTAGELKQFKRFMLTEMKERERLILGTENAFKQNMKLLQTNKQLLQEKGKTLISNRQDKLINDNILKLHSKLPDSGRLQYGSSNMIPYREEIDKIVDQILQHEVVKDDYENLVNEFTELDLVYQDKLGEKVSNMKDSEVLKIRKVIANEILASKKKGKDYPGKDTETEGLSYSNVTEEILQSESVTSENEPDLVNDIEKSTNFNNAHTTFKNAIGLLETEPEESQLLFYEAYKLMNEEISVGRNTDFFMFRTAQMHENGWGVDRDEAKALDLYRTLAVKNHEYGSSKFVEITFKKKNYSDYPLMQQLLRERTNSGDTKSGTFLAWAYLDSDSPYFDKDKGIECLNNVYAITGDENIKNSIDYYSNDYGSDNYQFNNAKGCINSALSAIKRSDAEVKKIVREGLEEYLETEKEREQKKYGKSI
ncbi:relaxase MobL [Erysipelothrix rhusiopathiae]|nr:relaxase MobL [Erysipelothrix rhusiopathiae]MDE8269052.1 relaxase MobL [Erysipelothrix rhusiopathiae]MDE8270679.1 relaxase MobL [Erysipelothrix rhusiopathiae]MDE8279104.1 relaxase MobL [Erysipelothrix rhusiopathiae]MDE8319410.1 relaxase MobL [Erysipelothrix rhusiopathiae]